MRALRPGLREAPNGYAAVALERPMVGLSARASMVEAAYLAATCERPAIDGGRAVCDFGASRATALRGTVRRPATCAALRSW